MKITSDSFPVLAFVLREDSSVASFDVFRALPALDELRRQFQKSGCAGFGWRLVELPLSLVLALSALLAIAEAVAWSAEPLASLVDEARKLVPVAPARFGGPAESSGPASVSRVFDSDCDECGPSCAVLRDGGWVCGSCGAPVVPEF